MPARNLIAILIVVLAAMGAGAEDVVVTDNNVRLREGPSTKSAVLGMLSKGTVLRKAGTDENDQTSRYAWVEVQLEGKRGFVYGEFLRPAGKRFESKRYGEEAKYHVVMGSKELFIGMAYKDVMSRMGPPDRDSYDDYRNEIHYWWDDLPGFRVDVNKSMECVVYMEIENSKVILKSGLKVGLEVQSMINDLLIVESDENSFLIVPEQGFLLNRYAPSIIVSHKDGIITAIHLSNSEPD